MHLRHFGKHERRNIMISLSYISAIKVPMELAWPIDGIPCSGGIWTWHSSKDPFFDLSKNETPKAKCYEGRKCLELDGISHQLIRCMLMNQLHKHAQIIDTWNCQVDQVKNKKHPQIGQVSEIQPREGHVLQPRPGLGPWPFLIDLSGGFQRLGIDHEILRKNAISFKVHVLKFMNTVSADHMPCNSLPPTPFFFRRSSCTAFYQESSYLMPWTWPYFNTCRLHDWIKPPETAGFARK